MGTATQLFSGIKNLILAIALISLGWQLRGGFDSTVAPMLKAKNSLDGILAPVTKLFEGGK